MSMANMLAVAAGGAVGATLRYATGVAVSRMMGAGFPWSTFFVNVIGSLLIGVCIALLPRLGIAGGHRLMLFLVTGVLGGFTTFSAFSLDFVVLHERGEFGLALVYAAGSVLLSVLAVLLGMGLTRMLLP